MFKVSVNRRLLLERRIQEDKNALIKALKDDDTAAAKKALVGINPQDLGLASDDFRKLARFIDDADAGAVNKDPMMNGARQILGVEKNIKQNTKTHNPVTNQPWSSGPVYQQTKTNKNQDLSILTPEELQYVRRLNPNAISLKSFGYSALSTLYFYIANDAANGIIDADIGNELINKIIRFVQYHYPMKFKDSDFPDI